MKLKKNILTLLFAGTGLLISPSCSLDEVFYSSITADTYFTDKESVYAALSNPFISWHSFVGQNCFIPQEYTADALVLPIRDKSDWDNGGRDTQMHWHTWTAASARINNCWNGMTCISRCLATMESLREVDYEALGLSSTLKEQHQMQLSVLMAYIYMRELDFFGGVPLYYSSEDPIRGRNTAQETFDYIEKRLLEAIPKLPVKSALGASEDGYIRQGAAAAMLAQLYFNAKSYIGVEKFGECKKLCEDIIGGIYGPYELDKTWYGPFSFNNDQSPEAIWNVPSQNSKLQFDWYYGHQYPYNIQAYFGEGMGGGSNGGQLSPSLDPENNFEPYTKTKSWKLGSPMQKFHALDLRVKPYKYLGLGQYEGMLLRDRLPGVIGRKSSAGKEITLKDYICLYSKGELISTVEKAEEDSGYRLVKHPIPNAEDISTRYNPDFPLIRLTEIYYMLAECKWHEGDRKGAASLINQVRSRNFTGGIDPDPVTDENLDKYRLADEFMIEYIGEGRRRTDLIRWGMFHTENWWDHEASNDPNRCRFPVPEKAISANPLLEQNPGYGGVTTTE